MTARTRRERARAGIARGAALALALAASGVPGAARAAAPDSTASAPARPALDFDLIAREQYLRRHAFSLDHFLEFEPDGLVVRLGPIGNDALYSRWGIGRGRAQLVENGIPLNDPQSGVAPWVHTATSGVASLARGVNDDRYAPWIEGSVVVQDLDASPTRPQTYIELSKGGNEVRQRRVRFASAAGRAGLDLSYDEVLDDGYNFDASGTLPVAGTEYGRSRTRNGGIVVRGDTGDGARYAVGLRRFRSSTTGDLRQADSEADRSGHLAWTSLRLENASLTLYGRGYSSTYPDSATSNETAGAAASWHAGRGSNATLSADALAEHTNATQEVGGAQARNRATRASLRIGAELNTGAATSWFANATAAGDETSGAWGAGAGVRRDVPRGQIVLDGRRVFRLPALAERYLPAHDRDGRRLSGHPDLDAESALEAGADWVLRAGPVTSRARASWMRARDAIAFRPVPGDSVARRASNGSGEPSMAFFEERASLSTTAGTFEIRADAAALYTSGDREETFASVPRLQVNASLVVGSAMFEKTSALYAGVEYAFVDDRRDFEGTPLPSFGVMNLSLSGRLIDARFYLQLLNVTNQRYQTEGGYLMTPRTLVYGVEWTLFD